MSPPRSPFVRPPNGPSRPRRRVFWLLALLLLVLAALMDLASPPSLLRSVARTLTRDPAPVERIRNEVLEELPARR